MNSSDVEIVEITAKERVPIAAVRYTQLFYSLLLLLAAALATERIRAAERLGELWEQGGRLAGVVLLSFVLLVAVAATIWALLCEPAARYMRLTIPGFGLLAGAIFHWLIGLICLIFATSLWTLESVWHFVIGGMIGGTGLKILPVGSKWFGLAKRRMYRPAEDLLRDPGVVPILYLRSFADDALIPDEELMRDYDTGKNWKFSFYADQRQRTFEEILCNGLSWIGTVVALERAGTSLPPLGAARATVNDENWRATVDLLVGRCQFSVLVPGLTPGLRWEVQHLFAEMSANKILLVVSAQRDREQLWAAFVRDVRTIQPAARLPETLPYDALALTFTLDGAPIVFTGEQTSEAYRQIGEWLMRIHFPSQ
ncbi:MAG TPA: hypothetical protein VGQ36_06195 [Thermoanaerobaculia bacterium]|nr:hypothetical protein [Thermoanaerobaculia bacterium]